MILTSALKMEKRHSDDSKEKLQQNVDYLEKLIALINKKLNQGAL